MAFGLETIGFWRSQVIDHLPNLQSHSAQVTEDKVQSLFDHPCHPFFGCIHATWQQWYNFTVYHTTLAIQTQWLDSHHYNTGHTPPVQATNAELLSEWSLPHHTFQRVLQMNQNLEIDLFTTHLDTRLPIFIASYLDQEAAAIDTLTTP